MNTRVITTDEKIILEVEHTVKLILTYTYIEKKKVKIVKIEDDGDTQIITIEVEHE